MKRIKKSLYILVGLCLILASCTPTLTLHQGLINRLRNRGPVPLASDNPFLAANLLVSKEMENSPELTGFVKHKGAPSAISIEESTFSTLQMTFYYPKNREQYALEQVSGNWIIKGPDPIAADVLRDLSILARDVGQPQVTFPKEPEKEVEAARPSETPSIAPTPAPAAKKTKRPVFDLEPKPEEPEHRASPVDIVPVEPPPAIKSSETSKVPTLRDSLAKEEEEQKHIEEIVKTTGEGHTAEMTPKGDLVHYVTYPGETLSMIARWYTFDRANAGRLARINRLKTPDQLSIGDLIVVPSYLVKNKTRLTEGGIKALIQMTSQDRRAN